jgi:dienelactone hydrolase
MIASRLSGARELLAFFFCAVAIASAQGKIIEEQIRVPVEVTNIRGDHVTQTIVVGLFHDDAAPKPYPVLVLNHGRAYQASQRTTVRVSSFSSAARWLVGFGFIVAVPIRVGYGATGGEDVEYSGTCKRKNYPPAYFAAASQTLSVINALRRRPDVAKDDAVVMGQSFGGTAAITVASLNAPGVRAAINFAGGGGGNPDTRPQNPCSQAGLEHLFADYGKTSRIPTLWVYSKNDMFFGPNLPRDWFAGFRAAGGVGEFAQFPAFSTNGHLLFSRGADLWQPRVQSFLNHLGYVRSAHHQGRP